jgi:N-acetylglucosaminyldiphosphoundecaprenol N-acetyl-beta-D-mannosaminyltransferase
MLERLDAVPSPAPESFSMLGVRVDRFTLQQTVERLDQIIRVWRISHGRCEQVVTVNPEMMMMAQRDATFRECVNQAALVVPDGMGIVWAARLLGKPTPERVTGTDTLPELARLCATKGYRLFLLGAAPGIAEIAAERLQALAPGLEIASTYAGSPAEAEEETIIERIRIARADVLCVAYGAPAQELWIYRNLAQLRVGVAIGVGGAFDFLAGRQQRAPQPMRRLGLEWLYRLYRQPSRWRRMLALPQFAIRVLCAALFRGRKTI